MTVQERQRGFTLLEMLLTLAILSIMLLLAAPLSMDRLDEAREKQFLNTLQSDLLYAQTLATTNPANRFRIRIIKESYEYILSKDSDTLFTRSIPDNWIDKNYDIVFKKTGVVRQPASFIIRTPNRRIKIVFPFGKGRARFEEI